VNLFSHRKGLKPVKSEIQSDSIDDDLRTALWNALHTSCFHRLANTYRASLDDRFMYLCKRLWVIYFKRSIDELDINRLHREIKEHFSQCEWYEVYDFIEFVANNYPNEWTNKRFMESCNIILKRELSAYRFVNAKIAQITSEEEISEIEEAIHIPISPIQEHLACALELFSGGGII